MRKMKKLIFIGSVNLGDVADDGETMKNRIIIKYLFNKFDKVYVIDTRNKPNRILYILKYLYLLLFCRNAKIIFSASSYVSYKLMRIANVFSYDFNNIYYWVIGGKFANLIEQGKIQKDMYLKLKRILVEGSSMTDKLVSLGFVNVLTVPNFKEIEYLPKRVVSDEGVIKFVFLSRIIPQKGVDLIISASKELNKDSSKKFIVDFYGKIDPLYEKTFIDKIKDCNNLNYKGFLNLTTNEGYDTLSTYSVMLFPTYWEGEGFPGIIIDAYVAGLPIIASDWNLNSQIIQNNETGIIISPNDEYSLKEAMYMFISRKISLNEMSEKAQNEASNFDVKKIISDQFLKKIELL